MYVVVEIQVKFHIVVSMQKLDYDPKQSFSSVKNILSNDLFPSQNKILSDQFNDIF